MDCIGCGRPTLGPYLWCGGLFCEQCERTVCSECLRTCESCLASGLCPECTVPCAHQTLCSKQTQRIVCIQCAAFCRLCRRVVCDLCETKEAYGHRRQCVHCQTERRVDGQCRESPECSRCHRAGCETCVVECSGNAKEKSHTIHKDCIEKAPNCTACQQPLPGCRQCVKECPSDCGGLYCATCQTSSHCFLCHAHLPSLSSVPRRKCSSCDEPVCFNCLNLTKDGSMLCNECGVPCKICETFMAHDEFPEAKLNGVCKPCLDLVQQTMRQRVQEAVCNSSSLPACLSRIIVGYVSSYELLY